MHIEEIHWNKVCGSAIDCEIVDWISFQTAILCRMIGRLVFVTLCLKGKLRVFIWVFIRDGFSIIYQEDAYHLQITLIYSLAFITKLCDSNTLSDNLKESIFSKYDKGKHIIHNISNTTVKVGMSVIHADIDEKNRVLVTDVYMRLKWFDKDLVWDKQKFGNVSQLRVNHEDIWKPDIVLYNRSSLLTKNSTFVIKVLFAKNV